MKGILLNVVVFLGFIAGSALAGFFGSLFGGIGAFLAFLFVAEKLESKRSSAGFWLRYRGAIVAFLATVASVTIASLLLPGFWGILIGIAAGVFIGQAVANKLGWGGQAFQDQVEFRTAYLSVLASASRADGTVSEKE